MGSIIWFDPINIFGQRLPKSPKTSWTVSRSSWKEKISFQHFRGKIEVIELLTWGYYNFLSDKLSIVLRNVLTNFYATSAASTGYVGKNLNGHKSRDIPTTQCVGWIPRNFKTFMFKPKLLFWGKITKMITWVNSWIFTNSPYLWFSKFSRIFCRNRNGNFRKIAKIIY